jgi:uncharacterized protein with von Willebrand factor type A (vWA) domain
MSSLLVPFFFELRRKNLKVGTSELLSLAEGLSLGLHGSSLEGFYYLSRALFVHRDGDLDRFDQAFREHFQGVETTADQWLSEIEEALAEPAFADRLARARGTAFDDDAERLRESFRRVLSEQQPGTDGDDPRREEQPGTDGDDPRRERGDESARSGRRLSFGAADRPQRTATAAVGMADARRYRRYRSDLVLDVRQIELALRRLRALSRDGDRVELDVEGTIDATARAFGELEVVFRPPRKSSVRVLLLMDVGGSMEPHARISSQLFSAARRASNLRELRTYYFHNVPYGRVFSAEGLMEPVEIPELLNQLNRGWKLVVVGDASMAPGEMLSVGPWGSSARRQDGGPMRGLDWLIELAEHFERSVWLNPDPPSYWVGGTVEIIGQVFQMYTMTLDGLTEAAQYLSRSGPGKRPKIIGNPRNAL